MCVSGCSNKKEIGFLASVFVIFYFLAVRVTKLCSKFGFNT